MVQNRCLIKGDAKSRSTFSIQSTGVTEKKDNISKYILGNFNREKISIVAKPRKRVILDQKKDMNSSFDNKDSDGLGIGLQSKKALSSALSQKGKKKILYQHKQRP